MFRSKTNRPPPTSTAWTRRRTSVNSGSIITWLRLAKVERTAWKVPGNVNDRASARTNSPPGALARANSSIAAEPSTPVTRNRSAIDPLLGLGLPADQQASPHQPFVIKHDFQACGAHRFFVLPEGKQPQFVAFGEVVDARRGGHQVMEFDDGDAVLHCTDVHPGRFDLRLIDEQAVRHAGIEGVGRQPGLDNKQAARMNVPCHRLYGLAQARGRLDVADRAEEAHHHVKQAAEADNKNINRG